MFLRDTFRPGTATMDEEKVTELLGYSLKSLFDVVRERVSLNISLEDFNIISTFVSKHYPRMRMLYSTTGQLLYIKCPTNQHERPAAYFCMMIGSFNLGVSGKMDPLRGQGMADNVLYGGGVVQPDCSFQVLTRLHDSVNIVLETNYRGCTTPRHIEKGRRMIIESEGIMSVVLVSLHSNKSMVICEVRRDVTNGGVAYHSLVSFGLVGPTRAERDYWTDVTGLAMSGVDCLNSVGQSFSPCNARQLVDYQFTVPGTILLDRGVTLLPHEQYTAGAPNFVLDLFDLQRYVLGV